MGFWVSMAMSLWLGFLVFQENNRLGMFFAAVVVAGGCNYFGFCDFVFIWVLGYIILLCKNIILMSRIGK